MYDLTRTNPAETNNPMVLISGDEEFSSFTEREKYELERGQGGNGETIFYLERDTCADRLTEGDRERQGTVTPLRH